MPTRRRRPLPPFWLLVASVGDGLDSRRRHAIFPYGPASQGSLPRNTHAPESMNTNLAFPLAAVPLLPLRHSSPSPTAASAAACAARGPSP